MKLSAISEGTFGDLISMAAAKLGTGRAEKELVAGIPDLQRMVDSAKKLPVPLFDRRAVEWWKVVFDYFKIPQRDRQKIVETLRSKLQDFIDPSLYEGVADFINPRTRKRMVKTSARAATNERLALEIIRFLREEVPTPLELEKTPAQKKNALKGKLPTPPGPKSGRSGGITDKMLNRNPNL